eukprot:229627-Pelagomonas_calceolata.AAC.4
MRGRSNHVLCICFGADGQLIEACLFARFCACITWAIFLAYRGTELYSAQHGGLTFSAATFLGCACSILCAFAKRGPCFWLTGGLSCVAHNMGAMHSQQQPSQHSL